MNKWSDFLCKASISKFLIEDVKKESKGKEVPALLLESISKEVKTKNDFKELEKSIRLLKEYISAELYNAIKEEQGEIKSDLKWIGTRRGKYILAINNWLQVFHNEFRSYKEFEDVLIGGHSERLVVFLVGKVKTKEAHDKLLSYVNSKKPPYKLFTQIEILENH